MTGIDDLFKKPGLPSKRKLDAIQDPSEVYRSAKLAVNEADGRHARVSDEPDDEAAGPRQDPDDFGPDLPPDDDEGRFFGGGISRTEEQMLDYVDDQDDDGEPEKINAAWVKRTAQNLERRITKNSELRAKFAGDPQKFIASEADLDADVKALSMLSEYPALYREFVRHGCAAHLVGLLSHENTDVAIDAVEILVGLTDDDVEADDEQWNALVDAALEADLADLLVSNLGRLDERDDADRDGVYHGLNLVENLCSRPATCEQLGRHDKLLRWLVDRARQRENPVSQNKQYSAEILAILTQTSAANRRRLVEMDATDSLLQLVAAYRKVDPEKGTEEEEYMENLFEALTCLADAPEGKAKFVEAEGVELCLIMLREGKMSRQPALRLLDHAVGGASGGHVCRKLVEEGGLKTLFTMFMRKDDGQTTKRLLAVFSSMLRLLPADSAERIRTLAKFVEQDYKKIDKLFQLRRGYAAKVAEEERRMRQEQQGRSGRKPAGEEGAGLELENFVRRLDAGLADLQAVDLILAWLVVEDEGASRKIGGLLKEDGQSLGSITESLARQKEVVDREDEEGRDRWEMLSALIEFLS